MLCALIVLVAEFLRIAELPSPCEDKGNRISMEHISTERPPTERKPSPVGKSRREIWKSKAGVGFDKVDRLVRRWFTLSLNDSGSSPQPRPQAP